ncbi:aromatic amino acid transport family protein [Shigella sonnei]
MKARKNFPNQMFTVWGGNLLPAIVILFGVTDIVCWFGNVLTCYLNFAKSLEASHSLTSCLSGNHLCPIGNSPDSPHHVCFASPYY